MDGPSQHAVERAGQAMGAEMRRLRIDQGLSLTELAGRVYYSTGYLSRIETGQKPITPEIARRVDEALETGGVLAQMLAVEGSARIDGSDLTGADVCPYPGLVAFSPQEARWFFGRNQVTTDLVARLDERLNGGGLLAVVAPSGAGKSSLLAAGLIPALAGGALPGSRGWPVVATTPGAHPLVTLVDRIVTDTGADPAQPAGDAGDPDRFTAFLAGAVAACTEGLDETSGSVRAVLIIDQFEEIFTECQEETERRAFIAALGIAAKRAVALVVLGVRADFYGRCLAYPALLTALRTPLALGPMTAGQLGEVITGPARAEGLELESGLVELLLRDLGVATDAGYDPGALPLLAHALRTSWQQRDGRMLTVTGYGRTGGIRQAVAATAERVYSELSPAEQQIARLVLLRLVNVSEQGADGDTRRRSSRIGLVEALPGSAGAVDAVLRAFGRARLLTFDTDRDVESVVITHEALLRAWPRLRQWIDTDRAGNLIRQELEDAATGWDRDGRDTAGLYRGTRLEAARNWAGSKSSQVDLSPTASAFLAAATHQERRIVRLRRAVLVVVSVLAVVASGASIVAFRSLGAAQQERDSAIFNQIVAQADRLRSTDVSLAAQLDLTAYRMNSTDDLRTALLTAGNTALSTRLSAHNDTVKAVSLSPDGHLLATGSDDQTIRLWTVSAPSRPSLLGAPLTTYAGPVFSVFFSPDGRTLASGHADGTVRLWNVTDPAHAMSLGPPLTGPTGVVRSVVFSPDGHTLATGGDDFKVWLWNIADPAHPMLLGQPMSGHEGNVNAVAFSPDGHTLASGSNDRTVRLWNATDPAHPRLLGQPLTEHVNTVDAVAFSPDGRTLATGSGDHKVLLWNVADPAHPVLANTLTGHTNHVLSLKFSLDGHTLASGSADRTVRLWNVADPANPTLQSPPLTGHTNFVNAVAFTPDGHTLVSGSEDHTVRLWTLPVTLTGHTNFVNTVAFSPDGRTLASGSNDRTVRLWNVAEPAHPTPLAPLPCCHTSAVNTVTFSPVEPTLATGSDDQTVQLWNITDPTNPTPRGKSLSGHTAVNPMVLTRDGQILVGSDADRTVRSWTVADPAHPVPLGQAVTRPTESVNTVAITRDERILATGSNDGRLQLWNITDPAHPTAFGQPVVAHRTSVSSVAFTADGLTLATASHDQTARLWNITDPASPTPLGPPLRVHTNSVSSVAFTPDGHTLATGSNDQTVQLWDVTDPNNPRALGQPLTGHTDSVLAVAFSPDGHTLATGSADETVRLWTKNVDDAIQRICATTTDTLTPVEWERYVSADLPYHPPCP